MSAEFTQQDLDAFERFRAVQAAGMVNMASRQVQSLADITREQHMLCMQRYEDLERAWEAKQ